MTSPFPQNHDDPLGEARAQILQALAVAATVGEATARWAAAGAHNRATKAEREATAAKLAADAIKEADRLAEQARVEAEAADLRLMDSAFDDGWLRQADLRETAQLWRTATMYAANGDERARRAMDRAEARLRLAHPGLMDAYQRLRDAGASPPEAMRAAAYTIAATGTPRQGRPHGNTPAPAGSLRTHVPALPMGGAVDDLDAAVREEVARLAAHVDVEALHRLQRQWRSAGHAPAADAAGLLAQFATDARPLLPAVVADQLEATARRAAHASADQLAGHAAREHTQARTSAGTGDDTRTPVDEHQTGLTTATVHDADADRDDTAAAAQRQRLGRAFRPLNTVDPLVAGKQPATVTSSPAPRRDKTR